MEENPVHRISRVYVPALRSVLDNKKTFMIAPLIILASGLWIWRGIGREFMPPLDEGSFLYMPSLLPQGGLGPAIEVNAKQDMAIATVPEVESVVGKLGRAESALDPGAHRHDGKHRHFETRGRMAAHPGAALVFKLARLVESTARLDRTGTSADHEKRDPHRVAGEDRHPRCAADFSFNRFKRASSCFKLASAP